MSETDFFRPLIRVLLGREVKNTDILLKIYPAVFRGLSETLFRFARVPV